MDSAEKVFRDAVAKALTLSDVGEMATALREESKIYFDRLRHEEITAWFDAHLSDTVIKHAEELIKQNNEGCCILKEELIALCAQKCSPTGVDETELIESAWEARYRSIRW